MTNLKNYPKSFSHIGITVPNIKEAVKFYSEVMGWYIIMEPSTVKKERETAIGQMCIDVFGEDWEELEDNTENTDFYVSLIVNNASKYTAKIAWRTAEEVETRFKTTLHAMHEQFIEPSKDRANLIVTNNGALEKATSQLDDWLKEIDR